jgi:prepilin-type N-terminal cleavage/methylation domain-containing protein
MHGADHRSRREAGFSLLELLMSLAVLLIVSGAVIGGLSYSQKGYRSLQIRTSLQQAMRGAVELMVQEIGQAGLQPAGVDADGLGAPLATVVASACSGSPATCIAAGTSSIHVTSVAAIYPNEWLWVDTSPTLDCYPSSVCEHMQVQSVSAGSPATITFTAPFQYNHVAQTINSTVYPTPIYGMGAYPQGVVPSGATPSGGSTASQLELFGDINGTGNSLLAVIYACPSSYPGPFTRTLYDATTGNQLSSSNLLSNVTACQFTYQTQTPSFLGIQVVTTVGLTITAQSQTNDPQTEQPVTLTKSFLNIQPRNVISALRQVSSCATSADSCREANELQTSNPGHLP